MLAALLTLPIASAGAAQSEPLPGYPDVDYSSWRVVGELATAERGTWSPDGSRLVLGRVIYDAATGERTAEIPFEGSVRRPSWSPDGRTILFESAQGNPTGGPDSEAYGPQAEGEGADIWAYDLPTGTFTRLTVTRSGSNNFPRFSHRGSRVTWIRTGLEAQWHFLPMVGDFVRTEDGGGRIENERALVPDASHPAYGAFNRIGEFTADDRGVLLISTRSNMGNGDVWRIDLATDEWTNLTAARSWEEHPRASPNGQAITFMSTRDYPAQSANVLLEASAVANLPAAWDNLLIFPFAIVGTRYNFSGEQYLAHPDGSGPRSLTYGSDHGIDAGWFSRGGEFSPDGSMLALAQRPVSRQRIPGAPPGVVLPYNGRLEGREPRTLLIQFDVRG